MPYSFCRPVFSATANLIWRAPKRFPKLLSAHRNRLADLLLDWNAGVPLPYTLLGFTELRCHVLGQIGLRYSEPASESHRILA
jgi:hypothetical protein